MVELKIAQENQPTGRGNRSSNVFRLVTLAFLVGFGVGIWEMREVMSSNRLTNECLASYNQQVGTIPFAAMRGCSSR